MNTPLKFKCHCGAKWKIDFSAEGDGITCDCGIRWSVGSDGCGRFEVREKKDEVTKMNIKEKLIEQIAVLEKAQQIALSQAEPSIVTNLSAVVLDYIKHIENHEDEDKFTCKDCREAELHEQIVNAIAKASDLPPELVQRVLDGQAEVLGED